MQFLLYTLSLPFLYFNYQIIISDIKFKKIPNALLLKLLFLLPLYYLYLFLSPVDFSSILFCVQILVAGIVSFFLFYFGVWSPGDAKYLLVLALFIPQIGIIPLIGNIALVALLYLLFYYIYFYFLKYFFDRTHTKMLYKNIYADIKEKLNTFLKYDNGEILKSVIFFRISKRIFLFLLFFVATRLARFYILSEVRNSNYYHELISYIVTYTSYTFIVFTAFTFGLTYCLKWLISILKRGVVRVWGVRSIIYLDFALTAIMSLLLMGFIWYEFSLNPGEIKTYLVKIATLYTALYILFLVLKYSYKVAFQLGEQDTIHINNLKKGDIVDISFIKSYLSVYAPNNPDGTKKLRAKIVNLLRNITNPIDEETCKNIKNVYREYNKYNKSLPTFNEQVHIQTLRTFAFGGYIFIGFLLTIIGQQNLSSFVVKNGIKIFFGWFKG